MDEQERTQLEEALGELDQSGQFLVAILAGLLLSLRALLEQRKQLCLTLAGEQPPPARLYPSAPHRRVAHLGRTGLLPVPSRPHPGPG